MRASFWTCLLLLSAGCYDTTYDDANHRGGGAGGGASTADGGTGTGDGAVGTGGHPGAGGDAAASGLPCDVDALLRAKCVGCHGRPPSAPMPLQTYEDLVAPAKSDPSRKVAEMVLARIKDTTSPMPPSGPGATMQEVDAVSAWVTAGYPRGTCGASAPDGGIDDDASAPQITCTSGTTWTDGDKKSPRMHPGRACITCHASRASGEDEAPQMIGGTVYPTLHEPNDCFGIDGPSEATVVIVTDATGTELSLPVGSTGNFSDQLRGASLTFPIHAKVVRGSRVREMKTPQMTGDCNSCHTPTGVNGAPGRILAP